MGGAAFDSLLPCGGGGGINQSLHPQHACCCMQLAFSMACDFSSSHCWLAPSDTSFAELCTAVMDMGGCPGLRKLLIQLI